jgi:CRISPR-associated exonuclease Cas4
MCLEAMFHAIVPVGMIFSAAGRRRHAVQITEPLRERVAFAARQVRAVLAQHGLPGPVKDRRRCRRCSMNEVCLPRILASRQIYSVAAAGLFDARPESEGAWDD